MNSIRYCFNPATGEYTGAVSCALSPARPFGPSGEPVYLEPPSCAKVAPPQAPAGQAAVFAAGAWRLAEDHRGRTAYSILDGSPRILTALGPVPDGLTLDPRPSACHDFGAESRAWVLNPAKAEVQARAERNALLAASDWTQLPDTALDEPARAAWRIYRQELRDHMAGWAPGKPWPQAPGQGAHHG